MKSYEFTAIKLLEKYSFSKEDAEAFLETIKEAKSDDNASKNDIFRLENNTKADILRLEKEINEIKKDIRILEVKIESSKNQILIWVIGTYITLTSILVAVLKYL